MRTNNRFLLSLLVPLTVMGQSNVWALSMAPEEPYKKTFQITGKDGGGYSITAVVKPAGVTGMPLSVIPAAPKKLPTDQAQANPPDQTTDKDDRATKPPERTATGEQPATQQQIEDVGKKLAEQMQKQQEELAKQLQKQQEELAKQLQKQQEEAAQKLAQQQQETERRLQQQQQEAQQRMAQAQQQANQQLANQQQQLANQLAQQQQQNAQQVQQQMAQMAQQQQQMAAAQMRQQQQQQRQLGRLFAQARRDQMMRNFEQQMFGNPNLMNQMNPNTAQGIMGLVNQMMQAASQMAAQRGGQGQQGGDQNQQTAQGPTAQEIAAELQKLMGDKLSTDAAEKVLAALQETAKAPSPQSLNEQMQEFTELGNRLSPQSESPSRVSSAADDLSVGPNDYEGLAKLADKLGKGDQRMTKQFLEMSLDAAGRVSSGKTYTSAERQKAREFALNLVARFKGLKEQIGSSSASDRSMRSALEFDIDKCMRINNETA